MDTSPLRPARVSAQISEDQQVLYVRLESDDGASTTLALTPGELGGLIASLMEINSALLQELKLQDAGPEGPGD